MAGNYPDVPAPRIAYDRNGTVGMHINNLGPNILSELSVGNLQTINNESTDAFTVCSANDNKSVVLIFPHLFDIEAYAARVGLLGVGASFNQFQYSTNTTNGIDGNWTTIHTLITTSLLGLRSSINTISLTGIKALKINADRGGGSGYANLQDFHIYGVPSAGENPDRLRLWHPTLDQPLDTNDSASGAYLDWDDVARGSSADRAFRVKNDSATLTANSISLTINVPTDTSPTVASQHTLSDGGAFSSSINIGNLSPGQISPLITLRRITASNAVLSIWTGRINIDPGSWS